MSRPRLIVLALAVASALTVAACGGDTEEKNDYVDEVNNVTSTLNTGLRRSRPRRRPSARPRRPRRSSRTSPRSSIRPPTDIEGISPPDDVTELHDQLVEQIQTLSAEATNAADEIDAGGAAAVAGVATGFIGEATTA